MRCLCLNSSGTAAVQVSYGWLAEMVLGEAWSITLEDRRGCGAYSKSSSGSGPTATTLNCGG